MKYNNIQQATLLLALSGTLYAANTPNISDALKQIPSAPTTSKKSVDIPVFKQAEVKKDFGKDGVKKQVNKFIFEGNSVISDEELLKIVQSSLDYKGLEFKTIRDSRIRTAPEGEGVDVFVSDIEVKVIDRKGDWYKIEKYYTGKWNIPEQPYWIHKDNLDADEKLSKVSKAYSFGELLEIASEITKYYRIKGYFVARAYIPIGGYKNEELTINIIEGEIGKIKLQNKSLLKDDVVQNYFNAARGNNIVSVHTLERAMLLINDSPGVRVNLADVMPGADVGYSDFLIGTESTGKYDGYALVDNYGSRYTGNHRLSMGANINSPLKIGDKVSFSGLASEKEGLLNGRLGYGFPLNYSGLRAEVAVSKTTYDLSEEYDSLDAHGDSLSLDATISYPIWRTRLENLYLSGTLSKKELQDDIDSTSTTTKKSAVVGSVGLLYEKSDLLFGFDGDTRINFVLTYGDLKFKDADSKSTDASGARTSGNFSKVNLGLSRTFVFTDKMMLQSSITLQQALGNKNLDGSEDLSIGGVSGVKVYPSSESSAENGYIINLEGFYQLPQYESVNSRMSIFYDIGNVDMANDNVDFKSRTLQDIGLGYYANYKDFFAKVQIATIVGGGRVSSEPHNDTKILFQTGVLF